MYIICFYFNNSRHSDKLPILSSLNPLILPTLTIFIYLKTKAKSDGYRSIMYRIADKKVQLIKHPFLCFIKAIFPLINYDDEPSMSKGIVSQLPPDMAFHNYHLLQGSQLVCKAPFL